LPMPVLPKTILHKTAPLSSHTVELKVRGLPAQQTLAKSVANAFAPAAKPKTPRPGTQPGKPNKPAAALGALMQRLPQAPVYETHRVRHGEDLDAVAARYAHRGVSAAQIATANRLAHFKLADGQTLSIPGPELRSQPEFQAANAYYQGQYRRYQAQTGGPDRTLSRRPTQIGIHTTAANQQNIITDSGLRTQSTHIHLDKTQAALQAQVDTQRNRLAAQTQAASGGRRTNAGGGSASGSQHAPLPRMANLGNSAEGQLLPTRIELDPDKAQALRHAAYEHQKTAYALGATDKGLWGNVWESVTSRHSASLSAAQETLAEISGDLAWQRQAASARMAAEHRAAQANERALAQGFVQDYRDIHSTGDFGSYLGGLALGTLPYVADIALASATGGAFAAARAGATVASVSRARLAGGFTGGYPSSVGDISLAQHEQGAGGNAWAAMGLGLPFAAANLVGVEGMAARLALARNGFKALDDIGGAQGVAVRATAMAAATGGVEAGAEVFQGKLERFGQLAADPTQVFYSAAFKHELPNMVVGAFALGGTLGGATGWRRRGPAASDEAVLLETQGGQAPRFELAQQASWTQLPKGHADALANDPSYEAPKQPVAVLPLHG
ncbi:MAG TPA: hypothetical protein PLQ67_08305, partial [Burkholderiaceae bacterium]|nr:hypothetical protein [Burkholderiaceae bacterium]